MPAKRSEVTHKETYMVGITGPFERIEHPGCFVNNRSGELIRVPDDALVAGRSPTLDIVSKEPWLVTKISNDPYLPLSACRAAAADLDLFVNF